MRTRTALLFWGIHWLVGLIALGVVLSSSGCSKTTAVSSPVVRGVQKQPDVHQPPGAKPGSETAVLVPSVNVVLELDKSAIFGQEFLYGADLQYSDFKDPNYDLY